MIQVAEFGVIRSPRRSELNDEQHLLIDGPLGAEIARLLSSGELGVDDTPVQEAAQRFVSTHADALLYAEGHAPPDTPLQFVLPLLGRLERWLVQHEDKPSGTALDTEITDLAAEYDAIGTGASWDDASGQAREALSDWIVCWLVQHAELHRIARATRLLLVNALLGIPPKTRQALVPWHVWDLLNRRLPLLRPALSGLLPQAKVQLVREASVADLHVVRSEWRCYVPGEVANIRNLMAGEQFHTELKNLREQELSVAQETEKLTSQETTTEQAQQSELSQQVSTQIQAQINGQVRFEYAQGFNQYNGYKVSGGVDGGLALSRSEQQASRIARQSVARAVSKVEERTRESRLQRTLTRTEDLSTYTLANDSSTHRRGIYRWVDRVDRYQTFRYPDRLQLEFELPEPAEYYRWRVEQATKHAALAAPPAWEDFEPSDITPAKALELAVTYHASNLPVVPDEKISVVQTLVGTPSAEGLPNDGTVQWRAPQVVAEMEIAVPDGYGATQVTYSGTATAARAKWHREQTDHLGDDDLEGFHSIVMTVLAGTSNALYSRGGRLTTSLDTLNTVQGWGASSTSKVQYGEAMLNVVAPNGDAVAVDLNPPAVNKVKVGIHAVGVATAALTFSVECKRSPARLASWQNATYDALFSAWSQWNEEWQAARQRSALMQTLPAGESSGARNLQTVRDELKRQVVSWLLEESPFAGRPALQPVPVDNDGKPIDTWQEMDIAKTRADAPTIQFLEQAFDWSIMTYVFYPYYWADRGHWDELSELSGIDPDFERFLRSGSARVVVPARPGMESAVHHWLLYQEPFLGQPMPLPNEPMYVSVATEIRDLTRPPEDGEPGDSWETRIGTTLLLLDDSDRLPVNPLASLGKAPHEPATLLCPTPTP